jgi:hypothetical protein
MIPVRHKKEKILDEVEAQVADLNKKKKKKE